MSNQEQLFSHEREPQPKARRRRKKKKEIDHNEPKRFVFSCGYSFERITTQPALQMVNPADCSNCDYDGRVVLDGRVLCVGRWQKEEEDES